MSFVEYEISNLSPDNHFLVTEMGLLNAITTILRFYKSASGHHKTY